MKLTKVFMITVALALCAIPLIGQDNATNSRQCSLATLNGSYGFFGEAPATLVVEPGQELGLVVVGIIRFDGHGNLSGESIDNLAGWGGSGVARFVGTYTVNPDCTYSGAHTDEAAQTLHFVGTISGSGMLQEMHFVVTDPGWGALGTVKKIPAGGCSLATLQGSYALFGQGVVPAFTPPAPIAHVGTVTYDGAGNLFGSDTIMLNGTVIPDTFTGKYTLTQECRISVEITSTAVGIIHEAGWIVGEGKSQEVRLIAMDPGFMYVEGTRKQ